MDIPERLRREIIEAAQQIATPQPMRRGGVSARSMKCGKAQCPCHTDPEARHGPYFSLTRAEGGKTHSRYLTAAQAELAHQQVEAGRQFRAAIEDFWQVCEQWADQEIGST